MSFIRAVILVIGDATSLDEQRQNAIRALGTIVEKRPFPALTWGRLIAAHVHDLDFLKCRLAHLSADKLDLLATIAEETARQGARIGLSPGARLLVHGYSGVVPSVLNALPPATKYQLQIFVTKQVRRNNLSEGDHLRDDLLRLDPELHNVVHVIPDVHALAMLQRGEIDTFVMSAKAIGYYQHQLCVLNTFSPEELPKTAYHHEISVLVVSGRYKMWPRDLFSDYAERVLQSSLRYDALIREPMINWFATESGAFSPQECRVNYQEQLDATLDTYPLWAPGSEKPQVPFVPSFFQDYSEAGLRAQVLWSVYAFGLTNEYFAALIGASLCDMKSWLIGDLSFAGEQLEILRGFWRLHLHLRTFYNTDVDAVRSMYDYIPAPSEDRTGLPWAGTSIKAYIERHKRPGIQTVQDWLESLAVPKKY